MGLDKNIRADCRRGEQDGPQGCEMEFHFSDVALKHVGKMSNDSRIVLSTRYPWHERVAAGAPRRSCGDTCPHTYLATQSHHPRCRRCPTVRTPASLAKPHRGQDERNMHREDDRDFSVCFIPLHHRSTKKVAALSFCVYSLFHAVSLPCCHVFRATTCQEPKRNFPPPPRPAAHDGRLLRSSPPIRSTPLEIE